MEHKPRILTDTQFVEQPETLLVEYPQSKLYIGIPKETRLQEKRVALVPYSVATLTAMGHRVRVQAGAGALAGFADINYSEAGAEVVESSEEVFEANTIIKVAPLTDAEIELMRPNQILLSPIHLPMMSQDYLLRLKEKRVVALAMEYVKEEGGSFPFVRVMSEIAGISAILIAGELLTSEQSGKGRLLGGVAGVPPAKVIVLGAGMVAETAVRTALGLGADVRVFDNNVGKLARLQKLVGRQLHTSVINPQHLRNQLMGADVAIGAIHSARGRTPLVVGEDIVRRMKPGSVIVDVSIDQGGCFETSEVTTLENPTFIKHDVIHYCVPNMPSRVARTASDAFSNILTSMMLKADGASGIMPLIYSLAGLRNGVYIYKGSLTNAYLGERFGVKYTNLELLITSGY